MKHDPWKDTRMSEECYWETLSTIIEVKLYLFNFEHPIIVIQSSMNSLLSTKGRGVWGFRSSVSDTLVNFGHSLKRCWWLFLFMGVLKTSWKNKRKGCTLSFQGFLFYVDDESLNSSVNPMNRHSHNHNSFSYGLTVWVCDTLDTIVEREVWREEVNESPLKTLNHTISGLFVINSKMKNIPGPIWFPPPRLVYFYSFQVRDGSFLNVRSFLLWYTCVRWLQVTFSTYWSFQKP